MEYKQKHANMPQKGYIITASAWTGLKYCITNIADKIFSTEPLDVDVDDDDDDDDGDDDADVDVDDDDYGCS